MNDVVPIDVNFREVKPTYSQDWEAYDKAKTNEDIFFKKLLEELLLLAVEEPERQKTGRKGFTFKEKLFCMAIKIFYRSDLRKATAILKELQNLRYIDRVPCFKSIDNFFNDKRLSAVLDSLILISALPLAELETTGAIDSTGFSTSRFHRWFDHKYGKEENKKRIWRKAHACIGTKTNIFLSVKVTESNVNDVSMFQEVLGNKVTYFNMKEFTADKAYLTREVMQFLHNLGMMPYIPFKNNSIGLPKGFRIWRIMFDEFKNHPERYMRKYHQRSNIETGFHMIKTNYGDNLMTKSFIGNENEIKVKFLCHNLCCLIQEAFENNIDINFETCVKTAASV